MVRVRVQKISSISDPETGKPGKMIELTEVRQRPQPTFMGIGMGEDESRFVQGVLSQFQAMGLIPSPRGLGLPKLILYLTEDEYELLGVRFEVNDIYDLELREGTIQFKKAIG
jgi:hypothetical protein